MENLEAQWDAVDGETSQIAEIVKRWERAIRVGRWMTCMCGCVSG